jgi:hypothetical protein
MANAKDIRWFKDNFHKEINKAVKGTVFDIDMLTALACQETGELWGTMRHVDGLSRNEIVRRCCGDTLDDDKGRSAFPRNKDELIGHPRGEEMFEVARAALLSMAEHIEAYKFAFKNKKKFAHGFGVFQYDLQFFKKEPDYFLEKRYEKFENTLNRALRELATGLKTVGVDDKDKITDLDFAHVAIAYNTGGFKPSKGLKQGHPDGDKFYGENIFDYLMLARTVPSPDKDAVIPEPAPGTAITPPPAGPNATGPRFMVDTNIDNLKLRSEPEVSDPNDANVVAELPDGMMVRAFTGKKVKGFIEVEALLGGTIFRGFAKADFLVKVPDTEAAVVVESAALEATGLGVPKVELQNKAGSVTARTEIANALPLNEKNMPRRSSDTADGLRKDLGKIIDYLASDDDDHLRYKPREGKTFCNIYAHDYCMLANVYLPRVWWTGPALMKLAQGTVVQPLINNTIDEVRANDLFRWLRDFGERFGWRRATSTNELQLRANQGAVSIIVARRKEDGKPGHITAVVPETGEFKAKRNSAGVVTSPLQSQAGGTNFRYGTGGANWWKGDRFAESAFWVHP